MGMRVIGSEIDPANSAKASELGVEVTDLESVLADADVVSLNSPLTPETRHLLRAERLARMKRGAWVINTGRGGLIDEAALVDALASGQVGAAALDVFEVEPLRRRARCAGSSRSSWARTTARTPSRPGTGRASWRSRT